MGLFSPRSTVLFKDYADYGIDGNHCSITIKVMSDPRNSNFEIIIKIGRLRMIKVIRDNKYSNEVHDMSYKACCPGDRLYSYCLLV